MFCLERKYMIKRAVLLYLGLACVIPLQGHGANPIDTQEQLDRARASQVRLSIIQIIKVIIIFRENIIIYFFGLLFLIYLEILYIHYRLIKGKESNLRYIKSIYKSYLIILGSILSIGSILLMIITSDIFYFTPYKKVFFILGLLVFCVSKSIQWKGIKSLVKKYPEYSSILSMRQRELFVLYALCIILTFFLFISLNKIYYWI